MWDDVESAIDNQTVKKIPALPTSPILSSTKFIIEKKKYKLPLTRSGVFIKFDLVNRDYVKKIENHFKLRCMQINGTWKESKRCLVEYHNERIIVPRFGAFEILNKRFGLANHYIENQIKPGEDCKFKWEAKLNPNQQLVAEYMLNNFYTKKHVECGSSGLVLNLPAGQGKSYLASYFMSIFNKKTLIIVHSTSMIEQWNSVLKACYKDINVGFYYSKAKVLGDVMICVIDSSVKEEFVFKIKNKYPQPATELRMSKLQFFARFGFIIYDECHLYANNHDGKAFSSAQATYMLGLSATPDENINKFDRIHTWNLGPVLQANLIPGYKNVDSIFKAKIHRIQYYGPEEFTQKLIDPQTEMISVSRMLTMLMSDMKRVQLVIDCIVKCLEAGHYTYVFADRRNYLELLRNVLHARMKNIETDIVVNENDFIRLVGGSKAQDLETAEVKSKCIFTTFAYGSTGRSIIKMDAIVLASPRKSNMKQTIGRILRLGSDINIERTVYDIVDQKTVLSGQWRFRKNYYEAMGFNIVETKIDHESIIDPNLNNAMSLYTSDLDSKDTLQTKETKKNKKILIKPTPPIKYSLDASDFVDLDIVASIKNKIKN